MTKDQLYPFSNFILKSYDMTKDNTKFVIIQDELNIPDQKNPIIYEWLSINTPAKYLYDLVDSSFCTNSNGKRNKVEYQLFNIENKIKKKIENDEKEIRSISGLHIIEIIIAPPEEKGKPK